MQYLRERAVFAHHGVHLALGHAGHLLLFVVNQTQILHFRVPPPVSRSDGSKSTTAYDRAASSRSTSPTSLNSDGEIRMRSPLRVTLTPACVRRAANRFSASRAVNAAIADVLPAGVIE